MAARIGWVCFSAASWASPCLQACTLQGQPSSAGPTSTISAIRMVSATRNPGRHVNDGGDKALIILPTPPQELLPRDPNSAANGSPFGSDIWGQAARALRSSDRIIIVGYSMPAADERARDLLFKHSNSSADILYFLRIKDRSNLRGVPSARLSERQVLRKCQVRRFFVELTDFLNMYSHDSTTPRTHRS